MTTKSHKTLTGNQLHEPKGVDAAAVDKIYVSDGAGSGAWQKLTANQLTGTGNPFGGQLLHVQDTKAQSAQGGAFTSGAWRTRDLNTGVTNEISGASLASNQITLPAGTYFILASAPAYGVNAHQAAWYNVTDGVYTRVGTIEHSTSYVQSRSFISGRFTIAGSKVFELRHFGSTTNATNGFGLAGSITTEYYSDVMIWKVA